MDWMTEKNRLWSSHQSSPNHSEKNPKRNTYYIFPFCVNSLRSKDELMLLFKNGLFKKPVRFVSSILSKGFTGSQVRHNNWNLSLSR